MSWWFGTSILLVAPMFFVLWTKAVLVHMLHIFLQAMEISWYMGRGLDLKEATSTSAGAGPGWTWGNQSNQFLLNMSNSFAVPKMGACSATNFRFIEWWFVCSIGYRITFHRDKAGSHAGVARVPTIMMGNHWNQRRRVTPNPLLSLYKTWLTIVTTRMSLHISRELPHVSVLSLPPGTL